MMVSVLQNILSRGKSTTNEKFQHKNIEIGIEVR
jgi:hypothetical protein